MSTSESLFSNTWNDASEEDATYNRLSILAVVALLFGLSSFLVFFSIWFGFLGVLGCLLALIAIVSINRSEGALTGLALAQCALACSLISLIAVSLLWPTYHYGVRKEADRFFRLWFQIFTDDAIPEERKVPLAMGMSSLYWSRPNTDDTEKWWTDQYENRFAHRAVHQYVDNELVRVLLALGGKAKVSYYKTLTVHTGDEKDTVVGLYAVSYPVEGGGTETFFVKMVGERMFPSGDVKSAGWMLSKTPELTVPDEWKEKARTPGKVLRHFE